MAVELKDILTSLFIGTYGSGNYLEILPDGTTVNRGEAVVWDDLSVSLTRSKQGINDKPDFDFTNLGLLFPQNNTAETVNLLLQNRHAKKLDSNLKWHVHYIQSGATQPTFKIDYRWYLNGSTVPGSWTTISTADGSKGIFSYTSGDLLQIATFPAITPPTNETLSSHLDVKFYRDDNDVTGDVLAKYLDAHYEIDTQGSPDEYTKSV